MLQTGDNPIIVITDARGICTYVDLDKIRECGDIRLSRTIVIYHILLFKQSDTDVGADTPADVPLLYLIQLQEISLSMMQILMVQLTLVI